MKSEKRGTASASDELEAEDVPEFSLLSALSAADIDFPFSLADSSTESGSSNFTSVSDSDND